jgi:bla regulator protein BlaR1
MSMVERLPSRESIGVEASLREKYGKKAVISMLMGKSFCCAVGAGLFAIAATLAQTVAPLKFEVASIKPADPNSKNASASRDAGEGLEVRNITVRNLITLAYGLRDFQLAGGPGWIDSESYDISAKATVSDVGGSTTSPGAESMEQRKTRFERVQERLRSLLADRFGLVVHRESRSQPVYLLTVAKNGSKLNAVVAPDGPPRKEEGRGRSQGFAVPMDMLVTTLSNATHLTVIDKTGLAGRFDYKLVWDPRLTALHSTSDPPSPDAPGPTIFTAVQEQLGLRLESGKAPVDVVVIERVEHAAAN